MEKLAETLTAMGRPVSARDRAHGVDEARVLAPVQLQGAGRLAASRPQRPVQIYQREGHCHAGPATTGHLCRYQEVRITRTGNFKNGGIDCRPKSDPVRVNVHDFEDKKLARSCLVVAPGTSSAAAAPNPSALLLLDCHRFRQIAGLVDIFAHDNSGMVGEHLEGDGVDDGREIGAHFGHR